jgi:hypothetical protein
MDLQTIASYIIGGGFGLWWTFFPKSVIKFYFWFHNGRVKMPKPIVIRVIGIFWTFFFIVISMLFS